MTRYSRQIAVKSWGKEAQERLKSSRVLLAGAGGLATASALYLLAGGVGVLRLVDDSRVGLADLNHQVVFRERDLGKPKATIALARLKEINPFALVESHTKSITENNVMRLASGCNLLIDASNNPLVGLHLNRAAVKLRIPLVHGAVGDMTGYLGTFWPGKGPCLACALLETPAAAKPPLFGPLAGVLGTLQAFEVLRILGGLGPALLGRIISFRGSQFLFSDRLVKPNPQCQICSP